LGEKSHGVQAMDPARVEGRPPGGEAVIGPYPFAG
jgi:hypothetical protein